MMPLTYRDFQCFSPFELFSPEDPRGALRGFERSKKYLMKTQNFY